MGEALVRVAIQDESGKIDLNAAPATLLDGLLQTAAVEARERAALVDAILDWRDKDNLRRPLGAEDEDYRAAGLTYGAKDERFDAIEELQRVLGMSAALYRELEPVLTVYSWQAKVNTRVAPRQALLASLGNDASQADALLSNRAEGQTATGSGSRAQSPASTATLLSISAEARLPSGVRAGLMATLSLRPREEPPYSVLKWSESGVRLFPTADDRSTDWQ